MHLGGAITEERDECLRIHIEAKEGRCEGRKPYGHYEGEQETLERIKALRGGGMAVDTIASTLNNGGVLSRSGGIWYGATVNKILKVAQAA